MQQLQKVLTYEKYIWPQLCHLLSIKHFNTICYNKRTQVCGQFFIYLKEPLYEMAKQNYSIYLLDYNICFFNMFNNLCSCTIQWGFPFKLMYDIFSVFPYCITKKWTGTCQDTFWEFVYYSIWVADTRVNSIYVE